jgi:hypothetical protein
MLWNASTLTRPPNFADAKAQVSVSVANENAPSSGKTRLITVAIDNRTGKTWKRPKFQVESLDANQNVLTVEHVSA